MSSDQDSTPSAIKNLIVIGGEGNDTLSGGGGRDVLYGGPGDDLVTGSPGADLIHGDGGIDTVDYSRSAAGISVNLATAEISGGDATGDQLVNIERVIATGHGDSVTGDDGANRLSGRGGDDTLDGGAGNDTLIGGPGTDIIRFGRGSGRDTVIPDSAADVADVIQLAAGIRFDRLWYEKVGTDLAVSVLGSDATILLQDFYATPARRTVSLRTAAGATLDATGLMALETALRGETRPEASSETLLPQQQRRLDPLLRAVWDGYAMSAETLVNADHRAGAQLNPTIAALSGGGYVVVWQDDTGRDGSQQGVFAQRFDAAGARAGKPFRVNTHTNSTQHDPTVIGLPNGGYVVVWASNGQDGSGFGIFGQRYAADGSRVGSEFRVNTHRTVGHQVNPEISAFADGGFIAVWNDRAGTDASSRDVFAQWHAADGTAAGHVRVSTDTQGLKRTPAVADLDDGGSVIVWASNGQDGSGYGIFGQRYSVNRRKVGPEFRINTDTTSDQDTPAVTGLAGGGFVVLWESSGQDGSGEGIYGRIVDKNGRAAGAAFRVNSHTLSNQKRPAVTALDDGGFMALWNSAGQDGNSDGIFGQRFNAAGAKVGGEFQINEETQGRQFQPKGVILDDGRLAVTWSSSLTGDRGAYDIKTRVLTVPATNTEVDIGDAAGNVLPAPGRPGGGTRPKPRIGTNGDDTLTGSDDRDVLRGRAGNDILTGGGGRDRLRGGRGNDSLAGGPGRDILVGDRGNDVLSGDADRDRLRGGRGNDTLSGGGGADRYLVARGDGADSIDNTDAAQAQDVLAFESGIRHDQLWFARSGRDLVVSVIGTRDAVTVGDWYAGPDNRHLTITATDGTASLVDSQVQSLVTAMAGYAPPALGTVTLSSATHSTVETVIAASWQLGG